MGVNIKYSSKTYSKFNFFSEYSYRYTKLIDTLEIEHIYISK